MLRSGQQVVRSTWAAEIHMLRLSFQPSPACGCVEIRWGMCWQADQINEASVTQAIADNVEIELAEKLVVDNCRRAFEDQLSRLAQQACLTVLVQLDAHRAQA